MADAIKALDTSGGSSGTSGSITGIIERTLTSIEDNSASYVASGAFYNYSALQTVNLPNVGYVGNAAFTSCSNLTSVSLQNVDQLNEMAFYSCTSLTTIHVPKLTTIGLQVFQNCTNLVTLDLPKVNYIETYAFDNCMSLTTLILRNSSVVTLGTGATEVFNNCPVGVGGYIYVPYSLMSSYKNNAKWSYFADQFRALEAYTVDGTTTGALDPTKI